MSIWRDPLVPLLNIPTDQELRDNPLRFGNFYMTVTRKQWEFIMCREPFVAWVGGVRSGKTWGGIGRGLKLSLYLPNNRGIVGRQFASDLEETTQRDFLEIADATGLVKYRNDKKLELYCWDDAIDGIRSDKATSEVLFQHLDNPRHLKGHGIGWAWPDETSETDKTAYFRLVDRLSLPAAEGYYTVFCTSNAEGRNWVWQQFYNPETVLKRREKDRLKHRTIHNQTKDNPFLTSEYLDNLYATTPAEWIRRYAEGEFDVFEGQIYKEFDHSIHCINTARLKAFTKGCPPKEWPRYMGIDTGGTDPWAFEIAAVDPYGNLIFYSEIYRPETYVRNFEQELKRKMKVGGEDVRFARIPMDYENQAAMEELRHMGIRVTNAVKVNKREGAINKLSRYLHPNPMRRFPDWHPRRGEVGSPGLFFTQDVPKLIEELPQQRWREINGIAVNEADPSVQDHATHALYYVIRERPEPASLLKSPLDQFPAQTMDIRSRHYWGRVAEQKEMREAKKWRGLIPPPRPKRIWVN